MQRHGRGPRLPVVHEMASAAAAGGGAGPAYGRPGAYRPAYAVLSGPASPAGGLARPVGRRMLRPVTTEGGATAEPVSDELDFEEYVTARGAALVRLARGLLRDPQHAEDLVQDVLVRAHQRWAAIRRTSNPDGYVYRMIVNAATSFWRRAARRELVVETDRLPAADVADASEHHGDRELMLALLRKLPAKQRAVLVLRHYEGLTDAEIADLLGTSAVTVRTNAHRGLAAMRKLMTELEPGRKEVRGRG